MHADHARDGAPDPEPLPPARTRWAEDAGNGPGAGSMLGPVRSGRVESFAAEPAFVEEEAIDTGPASIDADHWETADESADWDEVGVEDLATEGFVIEAEPGSEIELTFDAEEVELVVEIGDDEESVEDIAVAPGFVELTGSAVSVGTGSVESTAPVEPLEREEGRPTPLSAWDLTARSADAAAKARRAREEWDSLEQALVQSLDTRAEVRPTTGTGIPGSGVPTELEELARRLEQFAAALRTDGTRAMDMAQSRGDPIDVVLAAMAAGYISGRRE